MRLKIGFSTCPNDTFIFDALVHHKIDTKGLDFELVLGDVEELNRMAFEGGLDVTKISFHAYAYLADKYKILNSGSALGRNNGPLLISKKPYSKNDIPKLKIAIPGRYTTANLLLHIAFPDVKNLKEYLFSDIEQAILDGEVDAGVIIHETRFTYQRRGLRKIVDLGEFWESSTGLPVPLGGIIINRKIPVEVQKLFDSLLRQSIEFAWQNPQEPLEFIRKYAQEIEDDVMYNHIKLYVNDFTLDLGRQGRESILALLEKGAEIGFIPQVSHDIFV